MADEIFRFPSVHDTSFVDVQLSDTERLQLREMAKEGAPISRIMVSLGELKKVLGLAFVAADLNSEPGLVIARKLQAEMLAVDWTIQMWERVLSLPPTQHEEQN